MSRIRTLALIALVSIPAPMTAQTDSFRAESGDVRISPFSGASVQIEYSGVTIHVDPWRRSDYSAALPADLVLITDTPADHLDPDLIRRLRQPDTRVILPTRPEDARDEGGAARLRDAGLLAHPDIGNWLRSVVEPILAEV